MIKNEWISERTTFKVVSLIFLARDETLFALLKLSCSLLL